MSDFEIGVYNLGRLEIFWAILPDGTPMSEIGRTGLDTILASITDVAAKRAMRQRLMRYAHWLEEHHKLTMIVEKSSVTCVRIDHALNDVAVSRHHPDDLDRLVEGAAPGPER